MSASHNLSMKIPFFGEMQTDMIGTLLGGRCNQTKCLNFPIDWRRTCAPLSHRVQNMPSN